MAPLPTCTPNDHEGTGKAGRRVTRLRLGARRGCPPWGSQLVLVKGQQLPREQMVHLVDPPAVAPGLRVQGGPGGRGAV